MPTSALRRHPWLLVGLAVVAALAIVGVAVLLSAPEAPVDAAPEPAPTPEPPPPPAPPPEPEPEPVPEPVGGHVEVLEIVDLSVHGTQLFGESMDQDAPIAIDEEAVEEFVTSIAQWLDAELSALQAAPEEGEARPARAGPQLNGPPRAGPMDEATSPLTAAGLAGPDRWVAQAAYSVAVFARGAPEWASVDVEVLGEDGQHTGLTLVFVPGEPIVVVAGDLGGVDA